MNQQRTRRSPARFLAPLALIAVVLVFVMILNSSGGSDAGSADTTTSTSSSSSAAASTTTAAKKKAVVKKKAAKKTYTVQAGDTFGSIATKTGLTVEQLQELNPNADSRLLQTGQQLRVQ